LPQGGFKVISVWNLGGNLQVTDEGLESLAVLDSLINLDLGGARRVSDNGLERLKRAKQLRSLNLDTVAITDSGIKHLQSLTELRTIVLWRTSITDSGLAHLSTLPHLESLGLDGTRITDTGMDHLGKLPALRGLSVPGTQVTGTGFTRGFPKLRSLVIGPTTSSGIEQISRQLTTLDTLDLSGEGFNDSGLESLKRLTGLVYLQIQFAPKVTGDGLRHLKDLPKLETLKVWKAPISDKAVDSFQGFTALRDLSLIETLVTDAGKARLEKLLPKCRVVVKDK
jgi:hypothetical protein